MADLAWAVFVGGCWAAGLLYGLVVGRAATKAEVVEAFDRSGSLGEFWLRLGWGERR